MAVCVRLRLGVQSIHGLWLCLAGGALTCSSCASSVESMWSADKTTTSSGSDHRPCHTPQSIEHRPE